MTRFALTLIMLLIGFSSISQELRCRVTVNADKVPSTNKRIFKTLETAVSDFLNNYRWTKDNFGQDEKIECAILITIDTYEAPDRMQGSIQVSSNRPVFNSSYSSSLLNHRDQDFSFNYAENTPIEFAPDQFRSTLSSVLAYYAYLIIGMDYDSFALEGGTPYFQEAQRVVNNAQNTSSPGWGPTENTTNRFWIIDNLLQKVFEPLRVALYEYHRVGLDNMYSDSNAGRAKILTALEGLRKVHQVKPLSINAKLLFDAKTNEFINIFSQATPPEKERAIAILKQLDPIRSSKYEAIAKGN